MSRRKIIQNENGPSHNMATSQYPRGLSGEEFHPWGKRGNAISGHGTIVYNKKTAPMMNDVQSRQPMAKRDAFAAAALTGLIASRKANTIQQKQELVELAYTYADLMLEANERS